MQQVKSLKEAKEELRATKERLAEVEPSVAEAETLRGRLTEADKKLAAAATEAASLDAKISALEQERDQLLPQVSIRLSKGVWPQKYL